MMATEDILTRILAARRRSVAAARERVPVPALEHRLARRGAVRGFGAALQRPGVRIIAEIKRASPSRGDIAPGLDVGLLSRRYREGGAAAISVLTEPEWFKGGLEDLEAARAATDLPVLRKDFLFDRYQVLEAAAHGADAVLLIARMLDDETLKDLLGYAASLGLEALVEIHDRAEARRVAAMDAPLVGLNNRDLRTFGVDRDAAAILAREFPADRVIVAASGIRGPEDIRRARNAGLRCFLVGECLAGASDPVARLRALRQGEPS